MTKVTYFGEKMSEADYWLHPQNLFISKLEKRVLYEGKIKGIFDSKREGYWDVFFERDVDGTTAEFYAELPKVKSKQAILYVQKSGESSTQVPLDFVRLFDALEESDYVLIDVVTESPQKEYIKNITIIK
jgi:hypothetical protein